MVHPDNHSDVWRDWENRRSEASRRPIRTWNRIPLNTGRCSRACRYANLLGAEVPRKVRRV